MVKEDKNTSPESGENPGEKKHEQGDIHRELKNQLEKKIRSELHSLREEMNKSKNEDHPESYLDDFEGPSQSQKSEKKEDMSHMFDLDTRHVSYGASRRIFGQFIERCEATRLGDNVIMDLVGFLCGVTDSLYQIGELSLHTLVDIWRCLVGFRRELHRTKSYLENVHSS